MTLEKLDIYMQKNEIDPTSHPTQKSTRKVQEPQNKTWNMKSLEEKVEITLQDKDRGKDFIIMILITHGIRPVMGKWESYEIKKLL